MIQNQPALTSKLSHEGENQSLAPAQQSPAQGPAPELALAPGSAWWIVFRLFLIFGVWGAWYLYCYPTDHGPWQIGLPVNLVILFGCFFTLITGRGWFFQSDRFGSL